MTTKTFTSYNETMSKIKSYLLQNKNKSLYQISEAIKSDARTVGSMLNIMEDLNFISCERTSLKDKIKTEYNIMEDKKKMAENKTLLGEFLTDIEEEKNIRFGQIWRHTDKSLGGIVPIIMDNIEKDSRDYVMFEEVKDKLNITDTGSISNAKAKSSINKPVFIRLGTTLKGQTQERAVESSIIIMPNMEEDITVRCVHASRGISGGAKFSYAGSTPLFVEKAFLGKLGQSETWNRIHSFNKAQDVRLMAMASSGRTGFTESRTIMADLKHDDLVGNMEKLKKFKGDAKSILKNIPSVEGQIGCVIFDHRGVLSLEVYNHPLSWKAFHDNIYEKYQDILTNETEQSLFEFKKEVIPKLIKGFIIDIKNASADMIKETNDYKTYALGRTLIGEVTELNNKIIHVIGLRKEKDDKIKKTKSSIFGENLNIIGSNTNGGFRPPIANRSYTSQASINYTSNDKPKSFTL